MKRGQSIPAKTRRLIHERSSGMCEATLPGCTGKIDHIHHMRLRSRGGSNDPRELAAVCFPCHGAIHAHKPGTNRFRIFSWQKVGETEANA